MVILAAVGFVYVVKTDYFKSEFEKEQNKVKVPSQLAPVKNFLDSCVAQLVEDGADILGARAGYYKRLPVDVIPRSIVNPFSNSLQLFGNVEIPYWYYESANNIQVNQMPTVEEMEAEILTYVSENFNEYCISQLSSFVEQGYDIELDTFGNNGSITIQDTHIETIFHFPISIELNEVSVELEKHFADVDVNLGRLYDVAKIIMQEENKEFFLEEKTLDVMSVYGEIPYSEIEFSCEKKVWSKQEVVDDFKKIISTNLGALRIDGSDFGRDRDIYNYFVLDVGNVRGLNTATFSYMEDWPFEVNVYPEENGILVGDAITQHAGGIAGDFLSDIVCINNYHFVYDVKYPVLVTLVDDEGYVFQFSTMVSIDNNQLRENTLGNFEYESEGDLGNSFCGNAIIDTTVAVIDASSMGYVSDADVFFKCFTTECNMGNTESDGLLDTNFPQCINGLVRANKQGYFSTEETISTNVASQTTVLLEPIYELNYEIKVIENGNVRNPDEDEAVVFILTENNTGFITNGDGSEDTIELISGDYSVKSYITKNSEFDIEIDGGEVMKCVNVPRSGILGIFFKEEKCFNFNLEDAEMDEVVVGGAEFEFSVSRNIAQSEEITFYTVFNKIPEDYDDVYDIQTSIILNAFSEGFKYPVIA